MILQNYNPIETSEPSASVAVGVSHKALRGALVSNYDICYPLETESKKRKRDVRFQRRYEAQRRTYASYASEERALKESGQDTSSHKLPRTFWCGHRIRDSRMPVEVKLTEHGTAHYSKVQFCGSVWECPVCSSIIRGQRSLEVAEAVRRHQKSGGGLYLVSVTLRHYLPDDLNANLTVLTKAWRSTVSGKQWTQAKKRLGVIGFVRALEVTYSDENGWHPHFHLLLFTETKATEQGAANLNNFLLPRWQRFVTKHGGRLPNAHGIDVLPVSDDGKAAALYVAKLAEGSGVSLELTRSDLKESGEAQSLTPFELLDLDTPKHKALWQSYVRATKGKRAILFSRGLRNMLGMTLEKTDEEILAEMQNRGKLVAALAPEVYDTARGNGIMLGTVLGMIERKRFDEAAKMLGCYVSEIDRLDVATGEMVRCRFFSVRQE